MLETIPRDSTRPTLTAATTPWPTGLFERARSSAIDPQAFETLSRRDRLRLVDFAIAFVWADLRLTPEERNFVFDLAYAMNLSPDDLDEISERLEMPPHADCVDPGKIPYDQRPIVREIAERAFGADGQLTCEEIEQAHLLAELFA